MDKIYVISKNSLHGRFHVDMETCYTAMDAVCYLADIMHVTYCELDIEGIHSSDPEKLLEHWHESLKEHNYHDKVDFSIGLEVIDQNSKPESYHDSEERVWDNLATHNERFAYDDED